MIKTGLLRNFLQKSGCLRLEIGKRYYSSGPVDLVFQTWKPNPSKLSADSQKNNSIKNTMILHGLFGSLTNWRNIAQKLSDETNTNIISVDQRNHGSSPHTKEMSYYLMSEDLKLLIEKNGFNESDGLCLVGHSMGGRAAMLFSLLNPDLVRKLIVVDVSPANFLNENIRGFKRYMAGMKSMDLSAIKTRTDAEKQLEPYVPDKGVRQFLLTNLVMNESNEYYWRVNLDVLMAQIDNIADFPIESSNPENLKYKKPTLFIAGEKSPYIKERDNFIIKGFFPSSEVKVIPNAGHWVHADDPKSFLKLTSDFINQPI